MQWPGTPTMALSRFGNWVRFFPCLAVVMLVVCNCVFPVSAWAQGRNSRVSGRATPLRRKLSSLGGEIRRTQSELRRVRRAEEEIARDLGAVQARLRRTRGALEEARNRLEDTRRRQLRLDNELQTTRRRLGDLEQALARRLAQGYRLGPVRYVSVLLGARTMGEFVGRARFLRTVFRHDAQLIAELLAVRERVAQGKALVDGQVRRTAEAESDLRRRQAEQSGVMTLRRDLLSEARDRRREVERELAQMESDSRAIEDQLRAFERTAAGRRSRATRYRGGFVEPVQGPVVSGYGMRFHPILRRNQMHRGIDIAAPTGAVIKAAGAGTVVFAGWKSGYGKVVVVDHGGGLSTTYAHCSSLVVSAGQSVRQGQSVGRVGSTGMATGPHLHFEVRRNGVPVSPSTMR